MNNMFHQAAKFNQPLAWDTSKVLLGVLKQSNKKGVPRQRTFYWGWDMGWDKGCTSFATVWTAQQKHPSGGCSDKLRIRTWI